MNKEGAAHVDCLSSLIVQGEEDEKEHQLFDNALVGSDLESERGGDHKGTQHANASFGVRGITHTHQAFHTELLGHHRALMSECAVGTLTVVVADTRVTNTTEGKRVF